MKRFHLTLIVALSCAVTAPASAGTRGTKPLAAKQAEKPFVAQPIAPMPEREEKPRAGWNGAYVGVNAGGGFTDR